ncbi:hypothetical protein GGS21DRAFT_542928 [Xylaria nigripes]|nr:hypothetical protein GGS21DRAFT_542928 [Xylaria nigripes]
MRNGELPSTPVGTTQVLVHTDEIIYSNLEYSTERWMGPDGGEGFVHFEKLFDSGPILACRSFLVLLFLVASKIIRGVRKSNPQCPLLRVYSSLAWTEVNLLVIGLVDHFDFRILDARADDFKIRQRSVCIRDKGQGLLYAREYLLELGKLCPSVALFL